ncbi:MAG: hypothetical protein R3F49_17450 [Planctomycetota bacterium]
MRLQLYPVPSRSAAMPLVFALFAPCAQAQWSSDPGANVVVAVIDDNLLTHSVAPTADGGCWVAWSAPELTRTVIRVQRFDAAGYTAFPTQGVTVLELNTPYEQLKNIVVTEGGDLVLSATKNHIDVLQRIDPAGTPLWGLSGLRTSVPVNFGRIIAFEDDVVLVGYDWGTATCLAQRIARSGSDVWGSWVALPSFAYSDLGLASDPHGVFVAGYASVPTTHGRALVVQRIDSQGGLPWGPVGSRASDLAPVAYGERPAIQATGTGGAVLAYGIEIALTLSDIFVQRLDAQGSPLYGPYGMSVSSVLQGRDAFDLEYDEVSDGAVVAWWERELVFPPTATPTSLRVQNIDAAGTRRWSSTGLELSDGGLGTNTTDLVQLALGPADVGGAGRTAFVTWGTPADTSLHGGLIDAAGALTVGPTTVHADRALPYAIEAEALRSGEPQAVISWWRWDATTLRFELLIQNLRSDGAIGGPVGLGDWTCAGGPNSTGASAKLRAEGSAIVARDLFSLRASELPPNQIGVFLLAPNGGFSPNPGGSPGDLCLSRPIGRGTLMTSDPSGSIVDRVDLTAVPTPTGTASVLPGDSWHFQAWYREAGGQGNYSDGLRVRFL